jgi:hypothetical protein
MIKIYRNEETKTELKTPMLKVVKDGMCFADENGEYIAWAVSFPDKVFSTSCEKVLKKMATELTSLIGMMRVDSVDLRKMWDERDKSRI